MRPSLMWLVFTIDQKKQKHFETFEDIPSQRKVAQPITAPCQKRGVCG